MKITTKDKMRDELAAELKGNGIEIGVAAGEFSRMILDANKDTQLIGVDPYEAYPEYGDYALPQTFNRLYEDMMKRVGKDPRFSHIKSQSTFASTILLPESIDFVYIDGNHSFKYVQADMDVWWPKIKSGGIMAGDDYAPRTSSRYDVIAAVNDWCEKYEMDLEVYTNGDGPGQWVVRKP